MESGSGREAKDYQVSLSIYSLSCHNIPAKGLVLPTLECLPVTGKPLTSLVGHPKSWKLFSSFLGPNLWHMEVPELGVELELQLPAYSTAIAMQDRSCACDLHHSSQQCRILNPLSKARDQTCIFMHMSQVLNPLCHNSNSSTGNFVLWMNAGGTCSELRCWREGGMESRGPDGEHGELGLFQVRGHRT